MNRCHRSFACCLLACLLLAVPTFSQEDKAPASDDLTRLGHSQHGEAFDEGPRTRPWKIEGIGVAHFPITHSNPEVQEWFDQGNTLLHSYWYYEAERAFRWCLKLEPDNAMAYWGLARASQDRRWEFLKEAIARKDSVSERERMYIEAWAEAFEPGLEYKKGMDLLQDHLEKIILAYPDDLEAQAILLNYSLRRSGRIQNELLAQKILAANPEHPGAHHYRIHNWDGPEGAMALDSCAVYGKLAYDSGHANHMPGHVYSGIGMWHEGAIWMDSATRVEKAYMQKRLTLPFNAWNYAHNRNYLSYIQEQLGMPEHALDGARQLLEAPLDPDFNNPDEDYGTFRQGLRALVRGLIKFERWEEILADDGIPWPDTLDDKVWKQYAETLATLYQGDLLATEDGLRELKGFEKELENDRRTKPFWEIQWREIEALLMLAREETVEGLALLTEAAKLELEQRQSYNDPPSYPRVVYNVLGEQYLAVGSPDLARLAFQTALDEVINDGFAMAGLARATHELGDTKAAKDYYARLQHVWSDADSELRWMTETASLGLKAKPRDESPGEQRSYQSVVLDSLGPETWEPYAAPTLEAFNPEGEKVSLEDYQGQMVVLVFYLGDQCPHCVDQLVAIQKRYLDFEAADVAVLAVSSDTPEENSESLELGSVMYTLLSDQDYASARRFHSYDDFEEIELHSTWIIDRDGKVRWSRIGGGPFMDVDFLLKEVDRVDSQPWRGPEVDATRTVQTESPETGGDGGR